MKNLIYIILLCIAQMSYSANQTSYKFKIQAGLLIKESCSFKNEVRKSEFKVLIDNSFANNSTNLDVKVAVCPRSGEIIRRNYLLPLPTRLFEDIAQFVKEKEVHILFKETKSTHLSDLIADEVLLNVIRTSPEQTEIAIRYKKNGSYLQSLGQIKLTFVNPTLLLNSNIAGFNLNNSVPLKSLSVEIPDKNITLSADLFKISDLEY